MACVAPYGVMCVHNLCISDLNWQCLSNVPDPAGCSLAWAYHPNGCHVLQAAPFLDKIVQGVKIGGIPSEIFWFRAVATSYLLRLNGRTLQVCMNTRACECG
jgi:hypothetical protein